MYKNHPIDRNPRQRHWFIAVLTMISLFVAGCDKGGSNQEAAPAVPATTNVAPPVSMNEQPAPAPAMAESAVAAIEPDMAADAGAAAPAAAVDGEKVYNGLCKNCHGTGVPNIPQLGNKEAWAPRIAQGMDVLHQHAIKGFTGTSGMPMMPKGGNLALTDEEVMAAVDFMVSKSQ